MRDPKKNVTFVFYCYEKESADLKIRLRYDGLKQSEFFRTLLNMYVNQDPTIIPVVERIKERKTSMSTKKNKNASKEIKRGQEVLKELGITEAEKHEMFDMIEGLNLDYE